MFFARSPIRSSVEAIFIAAISARSSAAAGWRSAITRTTVSSSAISIASSVRSRSITSRASAASRPCTDCSALASRSSPIPPISEIRAWTWTSSSSKIDTTCAMPRSSPFGRAGHRGPPAAGSIATASRQFCDRSLRDGFVTALGRLARKAEPRGGEAVASARRLALSSPARGSQTVKALPLPGVETISSRPSWRFRMCLTIARPRPVPPLLRLEATLTR